VEKLSPKTILKVIKKKEAGPEAGSNSKAKAATKPILLSLNLILSAKSRFLAESEKQFHTIF
jgi:hypothetical protein